MLKRLIRIFKIVLECEDEILNITNTISIIGIKITCRNNCLTYIILLTIICLILKAIVSMGCYYYYIIRIKEINITNFDLNRIKIDEKSYKNVVIYYIGYIITKNLSYVKINTVNPLYFII